MKVKENYELKNVLGEYIVIPQGSEMKVFSGAMVLSEESAFVWNLLKKETTREELLSSVLKEYDVSQEKAAEDLDGMLRQLEEYGILLWE